MLFVLLPVEAAAIWSILGGYLLLPSTITVDLHFLPPLDKSNIPAVSAFLLCWMKGAQSPAPRRSSLIYVFAFGFVVSAMLTTLDNSYELHIGDRSLPGFYPLDGVKLAIQNAITLLPFFVGLRFLSSDEGRAQLIKTIAIAALVYSLPMLFELRMSPQLQRLIYGADPGGFNTLIRGGGYRPLVFLSNGLELALFTSIGFIAVIVAVRAKWRPLHLPAGAAAIYLGGLLLLCKTLATIVYGAVAAPLILFMAPKTWVRISCVVVLIICAYPALRTYDIIPVHRVVSAADTISAERAGSFAYRVKNEDKLLAKANEKALFGWGTWGRNRIYDQESGSDESVTDGAWIIRFGMFGWFGYLSLFGLFATAIFGARSVVKGPVTASAINVGGLTLLLAVNLIDLIPNASLVPLTYLMAGSIAGRAGARVTLGARMRPRRRVPAAIAAEAELAA